MTYRSPSGVAATVREPVPEGLREQAVLVLETAREALEPLGVDRIELVVGGRLGHAEYHVGYGFGEERARVQAGLRSAVSVRLPAAVDYHLLQVCPIARLPVTDPGLLEERRKLRGPWWRMWPVALLVAPLAAFFVGQIFFGRGTLVASVGLRGPGHGTTTFTAGADPLALWADLDGAFRGATGSSTLDDILPVHYEIDLLRGGAVVHHLSVDTQRRRSVQKKYCTVAPECEVFLLELPPLPPGPIELRATGAPAPNVTSVVNMSLNVRESGFF